jgi:hypothetical protein
MPRDSQVRIATHVHEPLGLGSDVQARASLVPAAVLSIRHAHHFPVRVKTGPTRRWHRRDWRSTPTSRRSWRRCGSAR